MYLITFTSSLLCISAYSRSKNIKHKIFFISLGILIPSLLAGFRDYSIGYDVLLYGKPWFEKACEYDSLYLFLQNANEYNIGIGYAFVNYIISRLSNNPHFFLFMYELLQLVLLYFAIKPFEDKINITFAFFIYYFSFYNLSLNILRQIMAILIIFFSYRFVLNKKLISFLITILISYSFHSTGIVGIALYPIHWFINKKNFRKPATFLIIAGGLLIVFGYRFIFTIFAKYGLLSFERYIHYFEDEDVGGRYVRFLYWSLILFFIIWRGKSSIKENKNLYSMEIYLILSFLFSLLMFFGSSWIIRVSYYFDIFLVLYMPLLAKNTGFKILGNKYDGYLQVGILVIFYWLVTFIIRNGGFTYPYVFMIN